MRSCCISVLSLSSSQLNALDNLYPVRACMSFGFEKHNNKHPAWVVLGKQSFGVLVISLLGDGAWNIVHRVAGIGVRLNRRVNDNYTPSLSGKLLFRLRPKAGLIFDNPGKVA